jgi:hypothetical protein
VANTDSGSSARARPIVYRYGTVLLILSAAATFAMVAPSGLWPEVAGTLLECAAVVVIFLRRGIRRSLLLLPGALLVIAIASRVVSLFGGRYAVGVAAFAGAGLLAMLPYAVIVEFRRDTTVSAQSVMAALCVYIVFGLFFARLAPAVSAVVGQPYFAGVKTADESDYVYFSFITLTTVGYGDLAPMLHVGRALAVLEAVMGQLYLVTVVALIVSDVASRRMSTRHKPHE